MDEPNRDILRHLQRDGRLSNAALADRIGLSPTPTLRRVRALERERVITGYHAAVDAEAVGRGFLVLAWVNLANMTRETIEAFERAVAMLDDVIEAHRLHGEPDYLGRIMVADSASYEELYTTRIATLPGVDRARSQMAMKTVKQSHRLPVSSGLPRPRSVPRR